MPLTAFGVPCVRAQIVSRPGTPPETMSTEPDSSASFMAAGLLKVAHTTLTSGMPARLGVLLEQLVLLHHVELQVAHRELTREADLGHLRGRRGGKDRQHQPGEHRNRRLPSSSRSSYAHRLPPSCRSLGSRLRRRGGRSPWSPSPARAACSAARRAGSRARRCARCRCCPTSARRPRPSCGRGNTSPAPGARTDNSSSSVALGFRHAVDAHGIARIAVENGAAGDRVGAKDRLRHRRLLGALLRRERPRAASPGRARIMSQNLAKSCVAVRPASRA